MILRLYRDRLVARALSCLTSHGGTARHVYPLLFLALILIAARPIPVLAAIIYGDYMGSTVNYTMVTEESPTGDPLPMYGPPTILEFPYPALPCAVATCTLPGDSLDFNPVGFDANSSNGSAPDSTDGQLMFMVEAKNKQTQGLSNIKFKEFGDTTLAGNSATDATQTRVTSDIFIDIVEVNGVGINPVKIQVAQAFTPFGGTYLLGTHGGTFFHTQWMGEKLVDLQAALLADPAGYSASSRITKINVNMDNTLTALSQAAPTASTALIAKKDQIIITINVPEPASCGLALMAMVVGGCFARRSRP